LTPPVDDGYRAGAQPNLPHEALAIASTVADAANRTDSATQRRAWASIGPAAIIALAAIAALATRLFLLGDKSIWLDEAWSWRAAEISIPSMIDRTKGDVHPPLYYAILHYWVDVFGGSEYALRLPSALFGAASITLITAAAWRIGGRILAALTALLLIINPADLQFTQEARMYPLVGLLSLGATLLLAAFLRRPRAPALVAYAAVAVALAYTHYSGFIVLGVHGVLFAFYGVRQWRREGDYGILTGATVAALAVVIAYIPWWSTFFSQSGSGVGHVPDPTVSLAGATLRAALGLRSLHALWVVLALPLLGAIALGVWRRRDDERVVALAALALVPAALFVASLIVKPAFDIKRAAPFIPALAFVSAVGLVEAAGLARRALSPDRQRIAFAVLGLFLVGLVATMGVGVRDWYHRGPYEDWRQFSEDIATQPGPVYYYAGYLDDPLDYYVSDRERLYPLNTKPDSIGLTMILASGRTPGDRGFLVLSHADRGEGDAIEAVIGRAYDIGPAVEYSGGTIAVYPLTRKPQDVRSAPISLGAN
jgi:hypothetical protein